MKYVLLTVLVILLATGAKAQAGMPQSLSCTETALNFSFSLGTKWKFTAPKMGPVKVTTYQPDFMPGLSAKIIAVKPKVNFNDDLHSWTLDTGMISRRRFFSFGSSQPDTQFTLAK